LISHGFHQDPTFYYYTGLANVVGAILALDGPTKESYLFVPPTLSGVVGTLRNPFVTIGRDTVSQLLVNHLLDWNEFPSYIQRRLAAKPDIVLYTDDLGAFMFPPSLDSNPPGIAAIENPLLLWRRALEARWPTAVVKSASAVIQELRLIKSEAEINVMRRVGSVSARALLVGMRTIEPGRYQREVEAQIVGACMANGGEGPSFWPLAATGPNSAVPGYLEGLADYRHMNRVMKSGDLTHLDLGCEVDHYGGDVGRTVPVSGHFEAGQREAWNLLVRAYEAGLAVMRDSSHRQEVFAAAVREVKRLASSVKTELGKKAVAALTGENGTKEWYLHSSGVECCETQPEVLRSGMVVVFEPSMTLDGQGYYLEDMILITPSGFDMLTPGLPYSADEIEQLLIRKK
jgi:Xaa-Pro aminopeptidase